MLKRGTIKRYYCITWYFRQNIGRRFSREPWSLEEVCLGIAGRYEVVFLEIGVDNDHVHFLVQSVPKIAVTRIVTIMKSITARELYCRHKELKKLLWGGLIWMSGYYVNTMGCYANEQVIKDSVKSQGGKYR